MATLYRRYVRSVTGSHGTPDDDTDPSDGRSSEGYSLGQRYLASLTGTGLPPRQVGTRAVPDLSAGRLPNIYAPGRRHDDLDSVSSQALPSSLRDKPSAPPGYTYRWNVGVRLLAAGAAIAAVGGVALGVFLTVIPHHSLPGSARPLPVPTKTITFPPGGPATGGRAEITSPARDARLVAGSYAQFQGVVADPVAPGHHLELFETLSRTPPYFLASAPDGLVINGWTGAWAGMAYVGGPGQLTFYLVDLPPAAVRALHPGPYDVKHGYLSIKSLRGTILAKVDIISSVAP